VSASTPGDDDPGLGEAETIDAPGRTGERSAASAGGGGNGGGMGSGGGGTTPAGTTAPSARGTLTAAPGTVLGRYQLGDELGAGGMATVYRARDPQLRRDVAIKVMFPHLAKKPEVARRFQREGRAAAGLEHPNILRVYDVGGGRTGGDGPDEPPYLVMELVRGRTLRELVDETGPILAEMVACIGALLCDALAAAHAAGIVHRDVKPGNVMVGDDGRLLLADFGVARIEDDDSLITRTGALLGTPSFMSPEQASGDPVDARSDLYSVGATLYQLATGSVPFSGPTAVVVAAIARGEYTPPVRRRPAIGAELSRAIEHLMALEPARRPGHAAEAAARLRALAEEGGLGEPREELARFLADPAGFEAARRPAIVAAAMARARAAVTSRALPRAMALLDRVLAIEPEHAEARHLAGTLAPRARRLGVMAAGGAGLALAAGTLWWVTQRPATGADAAVAVDAGAEPDGARWAADADAAPAPADAAPAPDAAAIPAAGRRPDGGVPPRRDPVRAAAPADAAPAPALALDAAAPARPDARPAPATLTVELDAWCNLAVDGRDLGRLDRRTRYPVDPGRRTVTCSQGPGMPSWSQVIDLGPGEHRVLRGALLGAVRVTIALRGGTAARIAGATHPNGAQVELRRGRLRVEVLDAAGAVVASGWVDLPGIAACTLRDRPALDCYR
jgi:eukaryotic-like serine/threonine-protein kinase